MTLLGSGSGDSLPDLSLQPSTYQIGTNGELLYRLCVALMEHHLADENLWHESGKIPVVFARNAIMRMIDQRAGNVFKDSLQYECIVSDTLDSGYYSGTKVEDGKLVAMFDLSTAGFLVIGAAISSLDEQEPLLGAALYVLLTRSLWRRIRLYDHAAANYYNERLLEMMEDDDPENKESYEFPKVAECIPPGVKVVEDWQDSKIRELLRRHLKGPHALWIEKVFLIERLTRLPYRLDRFEGEYDDLPVPSVLIVFEENDAIQACWDAESVHYNEANNEPACTVCFRPDDTQEFDAALHNMGLFLRLNIELANLIKLLNEFR